MEEHACNGKQKKKSMGGSRTVSAADKVVNKPKNGVGCGPYTEGAAAFLTDTENKSKAGKNGDNIGKTGENK